ncbi:LysE family translocator [Roseitranquillus sediminis]|uniref:LysE family translocator n=1 Tax=Roseitranquillus sediminis TaxID=2809051 RepID=UPI001D0CA335|nr:LysE family transporter [Roseitranquillus sediminis]MBM9595773.1 LysE family transporter [Roseitranquillus sediminis]
MSAAAFASIAFLHLLAAMSPGPSFVVSVRTAASQGFRAATGLAVGLGLGALVWAGAALTGLALLFEIAPWLLTAMKVLGGLFLVWIAVATWRHAAEPMPDADVAVPRSVASAVRLGLMTQLANPKPAIFFGAVFVGLVPADANLAAVALLLAVIFADETLWYILVARVFSLQRARAAYARAKGLVDRAFGGLIAAFGIKIAAF